VHRLHSLAGLVQIPCAGRTFRAATGPVPRSGRRNGAPSDTMVTGDGSPTRPRCRTVRLLHTESGNVRRTHSFSYRKCAPPL